MATWDLGQARKVALKAAEAGGRAALVHFRTKLTVERKDDDSPVTVADREAEDAIVAVISQAFPDHAVLGEERGARGEGRTRWIVDPIDGTHGFTRGGSFWGPLVALEHEGDIVAGAMALPALGRAWSAARGEGTWCGDRRVALSGVSEWRDATLSLGQLPGLLAPPRGNAVLELLRTAASARCFGDLASCVMLLDGEADCWLEAGVKLWDLAPTKILVEEAGGRFTDWGGTNDLSGGEALATNGRVHDHVLNAFK